jgi:hypothetical protein
VVLVGRLATSTLSSLPSALVSTSRIRGVVAVALG